MKSGSWTGLLAVAGVLACLVAPYGVAQAVGRPGEFSLTTPPGKAPEPTVIAEDGSAVTLEAIAQEAGRPVLVNFWAVWCAPCRVEMPSLAALDARSRNDGGPLVVTVSIDTDEPAKVRANLDDFGGADLPLYRDPRSRVPFAFCAHGLPFSVLLDAQGRVRGSLIGTAEWTEAEASAWFARALAEPDPS